jgi:hypothetical protein
MLISDDKTKRFAATSIFPMFFCAALGLVLGQMGATQAHGSWVIHVSLGMPGLALSGLALFRARLHWIANAEPPTASSRSLRWYLVLFAAGACIGFVITIGAQVLLGAVAALSYLIPWPKIPVCRDRFVRSTVALLAGAVAWLTAVGTPSGFMYLTIAAWMFYLPSMAMYLLVLASLHYGYRMDGPRITGTPDMPHMTVHVPLRE